MNLLSKQLSLGLLTVFPSLMLHGAASSSTDASLSGNTFADLCFSAQEVAIERDYGGYVIQTREKQRKQGKLVAFLQDEVSAENGYKIETGGTKCDEGINFCAKPESKNILYQDALVRVVLKPKYGGAIGHEHTPTDILIIPIKHYDNSHSLSSVNLEHRALLDRIEEIAERLALCLHGENNEIYTLQTKNGCQQGVSHLHVHFKSKHVLDLGLLEQTMNNIEFSSPQQDQADSSKGKMISSSLQQDQVDSFKENMISSSSQQNQLKKPFIFPTKIVVGTLLLGVAAVAAYGIYSWWKKNNRLTIL